MIFDAIVEVVGGALARLLPPKLRRVLRWAFWAAIVIAIAVVAVLAIRG